MTATISPYTTLRPSQIPLGSPVPALTNHAISVSLPTWEDNVGYEEADPRVVNKMETGYPRFFIHRSIQKVSQSVLCGDAGWSAEPVGCVGIGRWPDLSD